MRRPIVVTALPLAVAASLLVLTACSTSPESLENATKDVPGVIQVTATENDGGDNDIPFAKIAKHVRILMDAGASATQILAVFDAYEGDIDDGDVEAVEIELEGPKRATLATGARSTRRRRWSKNSSTSNTTTTSSNAAARHIRSYPPCISH